LIACERPHDGRVWLPETTIAIDDTNPSTTSRRRAQPKIDDSVIQVTTPTAVSTRAHDIGPPPAAPRCVQSMMVPQLEVEKRVGPVAP
jgi:hypothetical protein